MAGPLRDEDLEAALEATVAREEIRQLVGRYALAVDGRDLDALVDLFVDDVRVGPYGVGRGALRRSFEDSLSAIGRSILHVTTEVCDLIDSDHARGSVYCRGEIQDGGRWLHQSILYSDTYERRAGRWLFVRRRHELFYGAPVGTNPLELAPANWPEHHEGMGTLPERWDSWRHFWEQRGRPAPGATPGTGD